MDETGASLIALADGSRTLEDIASQAGARSGGTLPVADVAFFFANLGGAGYLKNEVYVNLIERPA